MEQPPLSEVYCSDNRGSLLLVLGWTLLAIALATVSLRIYFRLGLRNGISWDDYIIIASLVSLGIPLYRAC